MNDPGFKIESIQRGMPFRPRAGFTDYLLFSDDNGAVLVEPGTARQLRSAARQAAARAQPHETGGLLSGRVLCDATGNYVVVSAFAEAHPSAGNAATFRISPQETDGLRAELARMHPVGDVVGWWHTHLSPSPFSPTDLGTQSMWTQPESVGLLVFASSKIWGQVYLGPGARYLGNLSLPRPGNTSGESTDTPVVGPDRPAPASLGQSALPAGAALSGVRTALVSRFKNRPRTLALWIILIALILYLVIDLHSLSGQLATDQQKISGQIASAQSRISSGQHSLFSRAEKATSQQSGQSSVNWGCAPNSASVYSCSVSTSASDEKITWRLNGKYSSSQPSTVISLPKDSPSNQIQVTVQDSVGTFSGSQTIYSP